MTSSNGPYYQTSTREDMSSSNCQYPDLECTSSGCYRNLDQPFQRLMFASGDWRPPPDSRYSHSPTLNICEKPELLTMVLPVASNSQMYSLANGALQVHRGESGHHLAGLVEAATAAADEDIAAFHNGINQVQHEYDSATSTLTR